MTLNAFKANGISYQRRLEIIASIIVVLISNAVKQLSMQLLFGKLFGVRCGTLPQLIKLRKVAQLGADP